MGPATVFHVTTATPDTYSTAGRILVTVHVSCFENPALYFSAHGMLLEDSCLPQHKQLEFNFLRGKDLTLSNHLEEFQCLQNFCWDSGALVLVPVRVTHMQYKSSCARSFQIRLKLIYSWGQKARKESRKTAFVSLQSNEFHGKLSLRINTKLGA